MAMLPENDYSWWLFTASRFSFDYFAQYKDGAKREGARAKELEQLVEIFK